MPPHPPGPRDGASASPRLDDGLFVPLHGLDHWIALRGDRADNPALLIVSGPGAAFSRLAPVFAPWEADFTLVHWDQPNAGATLARSGWSEPYTLDRLAADGIAVASWVRARLATPLVLFCTSAGTPVGLKMIRARPDLFAAYVGNGQIVDRARQEALSYAMVLADARADGGVTAVSELETLGPPPWTDIAADLVKSKYANAPTPAEQAAMARLGPGAFAPPPPGAAYVPEGQRPQDLRAQATAAFAALKPELDAFDARALGLDFEVPMIFLQGAEDRHTVSSEVEAYAADLRAPMVSYVPLAGFGHMSGLMAERLAPELVRHVRPLAPPPRG